MSDNLPQLCYIHDIATAVPEPCLYSDDSGQLLAETTNSRRAATLLRRLAPLTGIKKRHLAIMDYQATLTDKEALYRPAKEQPHGPGMLDRSRVFDLAANKLVRQLLSGFPSDALAAIESLITVSCTHASSPGLELPILKHTPVPLDVQKWNLGFMGCSAALAGLRLVHQTDARHRTLVVCCELSSLHFQYTDQTDQMTANLLFADGAAAMIVSSVPAAVQIVDCRCVALPQFADQMIWQAGDHGLQLKLSPDLPDTLAANLPRAINAFLESNDLTRKDIDHWLVHPGGPQILDAAQRALQLPENALDWSRSVLEEYGNMSSPTIVFVLQKCVDSGARGKALVVAFGPGLTIEMTILQIAEP